MVFHTKESRAIIYLTTIIYSVSGLEGNQEGIVIGNDGRTAEWRPIDNSAEVSIILATYNEFGNLPMLVKKINEIASFDFQIIFIDDGSTDGTREFILDYVRDHPTSVYIFNNHKQSILRAHCQGIQASGSKFIIIMDADLQHPPEKISEIYDNLKSGHPIVAGSRYLKGASPGKREPIRGVMSRVATALAKMILKSARGLSDPLSGFYGFKREIFKSFNSNWRGYESYPFIASTNPNVRPYEVPYVFGQRKNGYSKVINSLDFVRVFLIELVLAKKLEIQSRKSEWHSYRFTPEHSNAINSGINEYEIKEVAPQSERQQN